MDKTVKKNLLVFFKNCRVFSKKIFRVAFGRAKEYKRFSVELSGRKKEKGFPTPLVQRKGNQKPLFPPLSLLIG